MRPSVQYALGFVVLVVGAVAWWGWSASSGPAPVQLLPLRPEGLPAVEEPIVGELSPADREVLLDELQDFEEETFGSSEAEERRRLRERILEARTAKVPQTR